MAVPVLWRTQKQRYSLQGETCPHCTSAVFPPRKVCPYCKQTMTGVQQSSSAQPHAFMFALPVSVEVVAIAGDD